MAETNGGIRVGEDYQAILPTSNDDLPDGSRSEPCLPRKNNIWSTTNNLTEEEMEEFFIRSNKVINSVKYNMLRGHQASISSSNSVHNLTVDGSWVAVNCDLKDLLHQLLYSCKFDKQKTIILLGTSIIPYISVWSIEEQQTFNDVVAQNELDKFIIERLSPELPHKTVAAIQNYHSRYVNSATELETNLLRTEPESVRAMLERMRQERTQPPKVVPRMTTSNKNFIQRFGNTFDCLSYHQMLSSLVCYDQGICSPAELVVRMRCVIESSVIHSSSPKNAGEPSFASKQEALNDFFLFLPEPLRSKLMIL